MDSKKRRNMEHLFREQMQSHEVPYEEGAWESMLPLLEEQDKKPFWIIWFKNQSKTFKTISIMTILGILAAVGVMLTPVENKKEKQQISAVQQETVKTEKIDKSSQEMGAFGEELKKDLKGAQEAMSRGENSVNQVNMTGSASKEAENKRGNSDSVVPRQTKLDKIKRAQVVKSKLSDANGAVSAARQLSNVLDITTDTITEHVTITQKKIKIVKKRWVEEYYTSSYYYDDSKPIKDFWLGTHFSSQASDIDWKSTNSGFNFQMMSGNIGKNKKQGVYAGLDWGMMFYGRTPNSNVIINTVNEDSGYTRLRNNSMDFLFRLHYEYPKFHVVPYINLSAGPRFYYTNQKVASYLNLSENESQSHHNADFTASFMAGAGVGTRVKVARRVSLDIRYEMMYGTRTKQVELDKSTFTGLTYQLSRRTFNPSYNMIKVGVIVDLSEERREKKLVEGHFVEESYDSLVVESSNDSTVIVVPCDCDCPEKKSTRNKSKEVDTIESKDEKKKIWIPQSGGSGSSGGSGRSKGSFPGIKTKPPVLK